MFQLFIFHFILRRAYQADEPFFSRRARKEEADDKNIKMAGNDIILLDRDEEMMQKSNRRRRMPNKWVLATLFLHVILVILSIVVLYYCSAIRGEVSRTICAAGQVNIAGKARSENTNQF